MMMLFRGIRNALDLIRDHPGKSIFSLLFVIVLLAAPVGLLVENVLDSAGAKELSDGSADLGAPRDGNYGNPIQLSPADGKADFCVTVEFLGIAPTTPAVDLGILVGVTKQGLHDIAHARYKTVTLWITSYTGFSSIPIPIQLSVLQHPPQASTCSNGGETASGLDVNAAYRTVLNNVTMLGQSRAFPDDWYELDDSVMLLEGDAVNGPALPSSLVMMTRDENFRTSVQMDATTYKNWPFVHQLMFKAGRPWYTTVYTYAIAALPFLLLIVLLLRQYAKGSRPEAHDVAFGVAAALVAILPLRTVLVPNTLPGLTRLDIFFGIGAAVLVALSILLAAVWAPAPREQDESGGRGQPDQNGTTGRLSVPPVPVPAESQQLVEDSGADR